MNYQQVKKKVQEFILNGNTDFSNIALELFAYQYEHNQAYRKFCRKRRISPTSIQRVTDIPPVPIKAFKEVTLSCSSIDEAEAVFMTSGTTDPEKRGKNIHRDLEVYDLSMKSYFKASMLPDVEKMKMIILFPTKEEMPNSSLAHYLHLAKENYGTANSIYIVSKDGFEMEELKTHLLEAEASEEPVFLLGATFSFIQFLDECVKQGQQFRLPKNSRLMETGGAKGRSRTVDPKELKQQLAQLFSIPVYACGNMYGMTELSSQIYTQDFLDETGLSYSKPPHWMKTIIVDPETLEEKPDGEKGIIVHYDLANINSVLAIMTEDVGIKEGDGFHLLGRAEGAEAKGCSLAVEQFLMSNERKRL